MSRTPNYQLIEDHSWWENRSEMRTVEKGSYVKKISLDYVPKHVLEMYRGFNPRYEVFVYCHYGIIPVPLSKVVEV